MMIDENRTVLVVDDSRFARWTLRKELSEIGLAVEEASSIEEALQTISSSPPDLIVLDLLMPGLSGVDALEKVLELENAPPVIVVSADIQKTTRERCQALGARACISKPVDIKELHRAIEGILGD